MNSAIQWLYQQFGGTLSPGSARCYLCGVACEPKYTVEQEIAPTFNSHWLAKVPSSPWLCAACQWYFDSHVGHPDFRKMSLIIAKETWRNWQRSDMKTEIGLWVSSGMEADAYLVVSLSKKKHILLTCPMNLRKSMRLAVQVEEQVAHIESAMWEQMDGIFMLLLGMGHSKGEILSGNLHASTLRKHGEYAMALDLSQRLDQWRNGAALELLSYVTIVEKEEIDDRGTNDIPEGTRDQADSSRAAQSSMERHRQGISLKVQNDHLDASRGTSSDSKPHYEQPGLFSE